MARGPDTRDVRMATALAADDLWARTHNPPKAHLSCSPHDMTYTDAGAACGGCGMTWRLIRGDFPRYQVENWGRGNRP
jgi:hypothetical protein